MERTSYILVKNHKGYSAGTEFSKSATYGDGFIADYLLEPVNEYGRLEVKEEELERLFQTR